MATLLTKQASGHYDDKNTMSVLASDVRASALWDIFGNDAKFRKPPRKYITDKYGVVDRAEEEMAEMGTLPEGLYRNRNYAENYVDGGNVALKIQDMLYDPQTSGGLLIAAAA